MTVVSMKVRLMTSSRLLQDYFKTIFRLIEFNRGFHLDPAQAENLSKTLRNSEIFCQAQFASLVLVEL